MATTAAEWPFRIPYERGIWSWLTTTDHKRIGILYLSTATAYFLVAVTFAVLMRTQTIVPNNTFLGPDAYNQIFTMHGTTMVFLFGMPILAGLANYLVPLMIGARDMVFPRLNAMSYWVFLFGGLLLYSSFFLGGAPAAGWFSYAPLTSVPYSPTTGTDFWSVAIVMLGVSSIAGSVNILATTLTLRAPGMTLGRIPLFAWATFVNQFLILAALPSLAAAAIMLFFDRHLGTAFFDATRGGDPLLWQHLFWFFGHPEVYILILPVFGAISEIIPVFSRKPIFGYSFIAFSSAAIGFLGFLVWAHHMFAVGLGVVANAVFAFTSFSIAVPTAIKIFNWLATMWGGSIRLKTSMLFACGFIGMFVVGGVTGILVATTPFDLQVTDSYFVVGHFHATLFGGTAFGLLASTYYWFPKITGRLLNEKLGVTQYVLTVIGFIMTFGSMLVAGLLGMPRRIWTFNPGMGWDTWTLISGIGAYIIATSVILMLINFVISLRRGQVAGPDPWDAYTLEWAAESPPRHGNFEVVPPVRGRRPLWDRKHPDRADYLTNRH